MWCVFSLFFCRLSMPPKHSKRLRNPSARAVARAAGGEPPRRKSRRAALQPTPDNQGSSSNQSSDQSPALPSAVSCEPQPLSLPPGVLDQLVARVADEVTRRLSPPEDTSTTPISNTPMPSALSEMPLVTTSPAVPVPGTSVATPGMAGAILRGSLSTTQTSLSGEAQVPTQLFSSPSLPIDARVSEKIRAKIWNNEFFDFSALLSNPVFEDRFQVTISNSDKELCLEPVAKANKHLSIETWLSCFHIFVGVYTSRCPHEAPALMKYGEVVQDLAARGGNWRFYDENFRFLRQAQPASFPWGVIHWELWMRAQHSFKKQTNPASQGRSKPQDQGTPKGYCFKFHRGVDCDAGCAFKHLCYKCEGPHLVSRCNFRDQSRTTSNRPLPAKSQPKKP